MFFAWSVEILKVGVLQRAGVNWGVVQKKKYVPSFKTLGRHTRIHPFEIRKKNKIDAP